MTNEKSLIIYAFFILTACVLLPFTELTTFIPAISLSWKSSSSSPPNSTIFVWNEITPTKQLSYTPCFQGLQCARLDVPLNWHGDATGTKSRAAIALVKVPARVPVTDDRYGGVILLNPGGPGNSGVHQVIRIGKHLQELVDSGHYPSESANTTNSAKYFDIIGFDSRGVNNTTPRVKCFPDEWERQLWDVQVAAEGLVGLSDVTFTQAWARAKALGKSCSQELDMNGMGRYLNTAQVVEDMVEIIERHGEWREREASRICGDVSDRLKWQQGREKLSFWGFSYGTMLGSLFAAMHPERVERLILDGVVDIQDYMETEWLRNLLDTDQIVRNYSNYCYASGPSKCPLYTGQSGQDIENRIERILTQIRENPIAVPATDSYGPEIITYSDVMLRIVAALYSPTKYAEGLFSQLYEIENRDGSSLATLKRARWGPVTRGDRCAKDGPFSESCLTSHYIRTDGPFPGIACMDGRSISNITKHEYRSYMQILNRQSHWMGEYWAALRLGCVGWTVRPEWSFNHPIRAQTTNPILLIGNTLDPVTPLRNAYSTSEAFPGSVVLQYDVEGHCSLTTPSVCVARAVRNYFQSGEVPDAGSVCPPFARPFLGCLSRTGDGKCKEVQPEDERILEITTEIISLWP